MLILGIDPGLNTTGFGLIETNRTGFLVRKSGFVKTDRRDPMPMRLEKIHGALGKILDQYKPDCMVLEKLYAHYKHPLTASLLGHARGVICMLAEEKNTQFFEYAATRVKKAITGSGHASKNQMQQMIEHMAQAGQKSFGPLDTTDALSLAITHAYLTRPRL